MSDYYEHADTRYDHLDAPDARAPEFYEVTHNYNAGRVPVTQAALSLHWNYVGTPKFPNGCLEFTTQLTSGSPVLKGAVPLSSVIKVVRPDDIA
jgi:hypothetical protein